VRCETVASSEEGAYGDTTSRENTTYTERDEDETVFKKPKLKVSVDT
jgi:hypothetical protein